MPPKRNYKRKKRKITKKPYRKKMALKRQPFVETKIRETSGRYNLTQGTSTHIPDCFEFMEGPGADQGQIVGEWIFSKWLTQKLMIDFTGLIGDSTPFTYTLMHGWLKINLNPQPDPTDPSLPIPVDPNSLQAHVSNYLRRAYENPLSFGDKQHIKILSSRVIRANPRTVVNDSTGTPENFRQNQYYTLKWTPMRKIKYPTCRDPDDDSEFLQCNSRNWVPFVFWQQNPNTPSAGGRYPQIEHCSRHWYTDS